MGHPYTQYYLLIFWKSNLTEHPVSSSRHTVSQCEKDTSTGGVCSSIPTGTKRSLKPCHPSSWVTYSFSYYAIKINNKPNVFAFLSLSKINMIHMIVYVPILSAVCIISLYGLNFVRNITIVTYRLLKDFLWLALFFF